MKTRLQSHLSPAVVPLAMIAFSGIWFMAAWVFSLTHERTKDEIFGAPVWVLLILTLVPLSSWFLLAPWLLIIRWRDDERLRPIDWFGLAAAIAPFAFIGVMLLILYFSR